MKHLSDVDNLFELLGVKNPGYHSFDKSLERAPGVMSESPENGELGQTLPSHDFSFSSLSNASVSGAEAAPKSSLAQMFERLASVPLPNVNLESPLVKMMHRLSS